MKLLIVDRWSFLTDDTFHCEGEGLISYSGVEYNWIGSKNYIRLKAHWSTIVRVINGSHFIYTEWKNCNNWLFSLLQSFYITAVCYLRFVSLTVFQFIISTSCRYIKNLLIKILLKEINRNWVDFYSTF